MGLVRGMRSWGTAIGVLTIVAGAWLGMSGERALAGKPPPPPPPPTTGGRQIYFQFGGDVHAWRMNADGTEKVQLAGEFGTNYGQFPLSNDRIAGSFWHLRKASDPNGATNPDGSRRETLIAGALDFLYEVTVIDDPAFKIINPAWRPRPAGDPQGPRLTFEGVHWASDGAVEYGLFEVPLTLGSDGRIVGGGTPMLVFATPYHAVSSGQVWPDIRPHAWIDENRLAYGSNQWDAAGNWVGGELRIRDFAAGSESPVLTPDTARANYALNVSPDKLRLLYSNYDGIYEVPVAGGQQAFCWIASKPTRKGTVRPEVGEYLDDNTITYGLHDINTTGGTLSTSTIYRRTRSGTTTQLTRSTEPYAQVVGAR